VTELERLEQRWSGVALEELRLPDLVGAVGASSLDLDLGG
jgi:hypothetical protein